MTIRVSALGAAFTIATLCAPSIATAQSASDVLNHYADIALATYEDSLTTAVSLQTSVNAFLAAPSEDTLASAKAAWIAARQPYQQTEAFRFGNAIVDDWEGRVNAWPLDEGLIDYVDASYGVESDNNGLYTANVVSNASITINGNALDIPNITPTVIADILHEAGQVESNVASGYHAIEFLLWGQDLNGTSSGAGQRPATDFDLQNCTNGQCERRAEYLASATQLLISDLEEMVENWTATGAARTTLLRDTDAGLAAILTGMGSLSYGELAGERMKLGLILHDPEEEHDCFSDNTHASHFYDIKGIQNVYFGEYERVNGELLSGPSVAQLVLAKDADLAAEMQTKLGTTFSAALAMVERAENGEAYDQMIGEGNSEGNQIVQSVIDGLIDQTSTIERITVALSLDGVTIEGSDSLDSPDAIFE